ncbi:solute carrier family 28 member 3-like [Mya arenaria]|uniref:solute carrier family 28 member 3-like n=1 Tax=Mya arenaria TaxID=6604 RepID=UPI0022E4660A|nr:solute carrier family 28 member 3-like [Mya arenaria]XP_052800368.1 solute carrier family 28 member 3-like [Mya arenaria]
MSDPVQFTGMRVLGDDAKTGIDNAAYINNEQNAENETKLDSPTSHKHEQKFEKDPPETKYEIPSEYDNIPDVNFGDKTTADSRAGEAEDEHYNAYNRAIVGSRETIYSFYEDHTKVIHTGFGLFLLVLYFAYVAYAFYYRFGDEGSWRLLGVTIFIVLIITITKLSEAYEESINAWWDRVKEYQKSKCARRTGLTIAWALRIIVVVGVVTYVIIDIAIDQPANLISVAGMVLYIIIFYIFSINPAKVNWHTVFWGIALQYVFALLILRTETGYQIFKWLGDRVTEFLEHTMAGILFAFGDTYTDHFFAMKVLSIVIFFFTFINIMYYLGVMQAVIKVVGRFLAFCMGTTPAESINAAANIFVSMTESPLMIRPFLEDMTRSELHAVMTGGFATIAGSVLGAYISFGVPANHLLSASVMSAPAALAISKLAYPEVEKSKASSDDFTKMEKSPEHNLIEAASNGATASLKIIGAILVNVIAFLSLLAFLNATLTWIGHRVGIYEPDLTFELITSYVLFPVSFFMGVETGDCRKVAELIGVKTFTNEFIAYGNLKVLIENRQALSNYTTFHNTTDWFWDKGNVVLNITGEVLAGGFISEKSEIISTYALCGFANFGSIGITLGGLGSLAPSRRSDLTQMVVRAMICGNVACFLTACIAGLLYKPF